jgi:hypothetical protein
MRDAKEPEFDLRDALCVMRYEKEQEPIFVTRRRSPKGDNAQPVTREELNPKHQISNNFQAPMTQCPKRGE